MARKVTGSFRLFTALNIDVHLHWSWFLLAGIYLYYQSTQTTIFAAPYWHALVFLTLFVIVTLHEFGHTLACRQVGGQGDTIVLTPIGGVTLVRPPARPGAMLWSIAAGPLVNVALVPITLLACLAAGLTPSTVLNAGQLSDPAKFLLAITGINIVLLVFNSLPVYPLDGGQILQAILWFFIGRARSLLVVAYIGIGGAVLLGGWAVIITDFLLLIIAVFLGWQALNGLHMARAMIGAENNLPPR